MASFKNGRNHTIMADRVYDIPTDTPGRLAILPRPRGGDWLETDVAAWKRAGFDTIVSLLTSDEEAELRLTAEANECAAAALAFRSFPVPDRGVPASHDRFAKLVSELAGQLRAGRRVVIHCRQGIGRSGLATIGTLIELGASEAEAIRTVSESRGMAVPETPGQLAWLREWNASPVA